MLHLNQLNPPVEIAALASALPGIDIEGTEVDNQCLYEVVSGSIAERQLALPLPTPSFPLERAGIARRRFLDASRDSIDLGAVAAHKALEASGIPKSAFRFVLVSSVTAPCNVPPVAAILQDRLGLPRDLAAFDTNLGCNGYLGSLRLGSSLLRPGEAGLVVTTEVMSRVLDAHDRTTSVIFGDGAAATVLYSGSKHSLGQVAWSTNGAKGPEITISPRRCGPAEVGIPRFLVRSGQVTISDDCLHREVVTMNGRQVFRDMVRELPLRIQVELQRQGLSIEDFDYFAFHQANLRIIEAVAKSLQIPEGKLLTNIADFGNTTSASIPILLAEQASRGRLNAGMRILLAGFGTGYSVGVCPLIWTL